jgi:hypothetical protein
LQSYQPARRPPPTGSARTRPVSLG